MLSAYEALERNQKTTHDSQTLVRSVRAAEQSLALAQTEAARLREELQEERRRARTLHTDKLGAERRVTEALAEISRLEVLYCFIAIFYVSFIFTSYRLFLCRPWLLKSPLRMR